ncbi:probable E3 ubiquitin-protein ligase XERICO [Pistacia vera]|uniref:probable E3 ubiquitin-protein ligase XERICO n=1 Tax=Pistacia vera TaxID=55513 RepID=UPI001263DC14|nr:probable E3 ubiquitin-protein ligase XERICO [Pistacia vera]
MANFPYSIQPYIDTTLNNNFITSIFPTNVFRIHLVFSRTSDSHNWLECQCLVWPRQSLLSDHLGPTIVSRILASTGLSPQDIESITTLFMSLAREMETDPINRDARVLTIRVFVLVATTNSDDQRIREDSFMQAVPRSIPASKEAIQKLEKVRVEDCLELMKECTVCSEEFQFDLENLRLPCGHVYHKDCIVKWLEISHMCPLCRYQLPCSNN